VGMPWIDYQRIRRGLKRNGLDQFKKSLGGRVLRFDGGGSGSLSSGWRGSGSGWSERSGLFGSS
jgi:hypothetical protein